MSHMVIYRGTDGKPGYHQTDDIHDAVTFVEQLRNDNGVEHARIFRLEEVNFEYRPYFRVELKAGDAALGAASAAPAVSAAPAAAAASAPVIDTTAAAPPVVESAAPAAVAKVETVVDTKVDDVKVEDAKVDTVKDAAASKIDAAKDAAASKVDDVKDAAADKAGSENGVGARRGLFGR